MTIYAARIVDDLVVEVAELPEGVAVEDAFHPDLAFVPAPAEVTVGMRLVGGEFLPPLPPEPPSPTAVREALRAYARDRRWQAETAGISIAGVPVATDDRSKMMIIGARMAAEASPEWGTVWQGADGGSYPLDAAAMIAISDAVQAHVNATFATLAGVLNDIEAGDITTREEIDSAFAA